MSRKHKQKKYVITAEQQFDAHKPQWNGFAFNAGAHGDSKYNRKKNNAQWRRELGDY